MDLYSVETQDLPELVELWQGFYKLTHDARLVLLQLLAGVQSDQLTWEKVGNRT